MLLTAENWKEFAFFVDNLFEALKEAFNASDLEIIARQKTGDNPALSALMFNTPERERAYQALIQEPDWQRLLHLLLMDGNYRTLETRLGELEKVISEAGPVVPRRPKFVLELLAEI
jgi:hypothetical protein